MSRIIPLHDIPSRLPRVGKISAGYMDTKTSKDPRTGKERTVTIPVRSRTLVFRCSTPEVLVAAQTLVGGTVSKSPNARAEGMWRLISDATEIEALIATDDRHEIPVRYEAWGDYGKLRDCDGETCRFAIDSKTGQRQDNVPCVCAARNLAAEDREACRLVTRLNLLIPSFATIPGIGVWQLESRGRSTYQDLKGLRDLLQRMDLPGAMGVPVVMRVDIVRGRNPGTGEPSEFPVFRFQSRMSPNDAIAQARAFAATVDLAQLPPPDDSTPPLGAVLTPEQEALADTVPVADPRKPAASRTSESAHRALAAPPAASDTIPDEATAAKAAPTTPTNGATAAGARVNGPARGNAPAGSSTSSRSVGAGGKPRDAAQGTSPGAAAANGKAAPAAASTRMPAGDFRALVHKAAVIQGLKSETPGRAWLEERFKTGNPAELTETQYEDAVRQARAVVSAATQRTPAPSLALLAELAAEFDRLECSASDRVGVIRTTTNGRTDRPEEMTEIEVKALLDELSGPASRTPARSPAAPRA